MRGKRRKTRTRDRRRPPGKMRWGQKGERRDEKFSAGKKETGGGRKRRGTAPGRARSERQKKGVVEKKKKGKGEVE